LVSLTFGRRQVFVANPKKPPQIENILRRNKEKLETFLLNFQNDKEGQFAVSGPLSLSLFREAEGAFAHR
jgi:hypothetical protein